MKAKIIWIGNSRGIRLPKPLTEECGFGDTVDIKVEDHRLVVSSHPKPREGWAQAFAQAGPSGDDPILLERMPRNQFDEEEWDW